MRIINMEGKRFGRLVGLSRAGSNHRGAAAWLFRCDCGKTKVIAGKDVRSGGTVSCGCYRDENSGYCNAKYDEKTKALVRVWSGMKRRCLNKNSTAWERYGGRGIKICERWINSLENFAKDMGPRPPGTSLDRINNDGDYCKENCRWATFLQQNNNRQSSRFINFLGKTKTISEWERETGVRAQRITKRLALGWDESRAISQPARTYTRKTIKTGT